MNVDQVIAELGDPKIRNKGDRRRDAMRKYAAKRNEELKELDRQAALSKEGVAEVACSWCGVDCVPAFQGEGLVACQACMTKALAKSLGKPGDDAPAEPAPKKAEKKATEPAWAERDPDEITEPATTKAVS